MFAAACSDGSAGGSSGPSPTATHRTPTPTPIFTQLGTLTISHVLRAQPYGPATACPSAADAFPGVTVAPGETAVCDPREQTVYLLAKPALNETAIDATTVAQPVNGNGWSLYLQLTKRGARAFFDVTSAAYQGGKPKAIAYVYDGVVIQASTVESNGVQGGLAQISGLSKHQAKRIAAALNPS